MTNETQHAFDIKSKTRFQIRDEDLGKAAQYALLEACEWDDAVLALLPNKKRFCCQICVMAMFSVELYLKAILMAKGTNVTNKEFKHKVECMFYALSASEQATVKSGITPTGVDVTNMIDDHIKLDSFEDKLKFISNDFIQLRYHYEKFMNGEPVYAFPDFILALRDNVRKLAKGHSSAGIEPTGAKNKRNE